MGLQQKVTKRRGNQLRKSETVFRPFGKKEKGRSKKFSVPEQNSWGVFEQSWRRLTVDLLLKKKVVFSILQEHTQNRERKTDPKLLKLIRGNLKTITKTAYPSAHQFYALLEICHNKIEQLKKGGKRHHRSTSGVWIGKGKKGWFLRLRISLRGRVWGSASWGKTPEKDESAWIEGPNTRGAPRPNRTLPHETTRSSAPLTRRGRKKVHRRSGGKNC